MEKELIRLLLQNSFWEENKDRILKEFFPNNLYPIVTLISELQNKYHKDITVGELKAVHKANNPTITRAQWDFLEEILDNLPVEISQDVAKECIQKAYITETARKIAQIGIDGINGQEIDIEKTRALLKALEQGDISDGANLAEASSELDEILASISSTMKWPFYLKGLKDIAVGIGPGLFTVVGARVETGKTAFAVSFIAAPGGFAEQGAITNFYVNEEAVQRTQGRAVMCWTGMTLQEILLNPDIAKKQYNEIKSRIKFYECRGRTIEEIGKHIKYSKPDIAVFDMLDKLEIKGTYAREDERLGAIYSKTRSLCIEHNLAIIGTSQLNADADGKTYISAANLSNARTSKAAEADLLIGIGKLPQHDDSTRVLNIAKNKITGKHKDIICLIRPEISRYAD